ncbi:MAG TPA: chromosomal replication initiator protein DnaA, partial [Clostridiales bacterium]|nr:chromosomal replication initiator protein DnaA [Clostridiales bacterium]
MNSLDEIWSNVMSVLSEDLTPTAVNTWFSDCTPVDLEDCRIVLHTGTDFKRRIILSRFGDTIRKTLSDLFSCDFDLIVLAGNELEQYRNRRKAE